jgi:hypothetical protein
MRGTSSNTISVYRDCTTLILPDTDPADPLVGGGLFGVCLSELPRPYSGLWVRDSLTVGACDARIFGVSVMLTSPAVIAWGVGVVESGREGCVTLSAADIGATA